MKNAKKIFIGVLCLSIICGCGTTPTTKDGKEAVVTFEKDSNKYQITADDLYKLLKDKYGFEELLTLMDTYILESEFEDYKITAKDYANNYIKSMKNNFKSDEEFLNAIKQGTNYQTEDEYTNYIYLSYMQSHAIEEYAKSLITDKQIEKYYNDKFKENIEIYHILITPQVTSTMNDDQISKEESKAKEKAENLLKEINSSTDKLATFKKLAKENSEDDNTKDKGGNLGEINEFTLGNEYDELITTAYDLKDGEVASKVVTTELGYHIIFRNATKDKEKLEDVKNDILEKLSTEVMASDANFAVTTMKYYRKLYNMEIIDSDLEASYRTYINDLLNATSTN